MGVTLTFRPETNVQHSIHQESLLYVEGSSPGLLLKGGTLTQVTWKKPQQINQSSSARIIVP